MGFKKNNPGCDCCARDCVWCDAGTGPQSVDLTFANVVEPGGGCGSCVDLNTTTFNVPLIPGQPSGSQCGFDTATGGICAFRFVVSATGSSGGYWEIAVQILRLGSWANAAVFDGPETVPTMDCSAVESAIAVASTSGGECDFSSATCTVTPV
mgnify:CR=1 FL=1